MKFVLYFLIFLVGLIAGFVIACLGVAAGLNNGELSWPDEEKDPEDPPSQTAEESTCIYCGDAVPEGRQICPRCEDRLFRDHL